MQENCENGRILWIDVARGIAILLVVLGHCIGNLNDPGNRFILAFHMPLFFFLSGMCISENVIPAKNYLVKKVKNLLVPQAVLGTLNFILNRGGGKRLPHMVFNSSVLCINSVVLFTEDTSV